MPSRSSRPSAFAAGLALAALAASPATAGDAAFADGTASVERVRALQQAVGQVRALPFLVDVSVDVEDPATMRIRMERELEEQLDPGEIEGTALTWRLLGLIGADFDIKARYAEILEENVGGYFDIEEGRLVLVERDMGTQGAATSLIEDMVTAHELVHALQDQHFDLWQLTRRELDNGDVALALQALVEGDASYAMLYRMPMIDPDRMPMERLAPMMAAAGGPSDDMGGRIGAAPAIVREPLVFPYVQGLVFAQAVKLGNGDGWAGIDAAYRSPPLSTEQILHPDKYVGDTPDWPMHFEADADRWLKSDWQKVDTDSFGELGIGLMLRQHGTADGVAATAAAGWDGDRYWTFRSGEKGALVWISTWDSEADAAEFEAAVAGPVARLGGSAAGDTASGVQRAGSDVRVWLRVPTSLAPRVLRRVADVSRREVRTLDSIAPAPEPRAPAPEPRAPAVE